MKAHAEKHGGSYRVRYRDRGRGGRKVTVRSGLSESAARKLAREVSVKLARGQSVVGSGAGFASLRMNLEDLLQPQCSPEYYYLICRSLDLLEQSAGPRLSQADSHAADQMISGMIRDGLAPATVNKYLRHAKAGLSKAVQWGMIQSNPLAGVKNLPVPEKAVRIVSVPEEAQLILSCNSVRDICIVYLGLYCGLRAKEISNIHVRDDINLHQDAGDFIEVHVRNRDGIVTKTKKERTVYVDREDVCDQLAALTRARQGWGVYPFYNRNPRSVSQRFRQLRDLAGVSCTLHDLRRTCATRLLKAGVAVATVAKFMGHSIRVMQEFYARIDTSDVLNAVRGKL